jgi:hypothetical protein
MDIGSTGPTSLRSNYTDETDGDDTAAGDDEDEDERDVSLKEDDPAKAVLITENKH